MMQVARIYVGMNRGTVDKNFGRYFLAINHGDNLGQDRIFPHKYSELLGFAKEIIKTHIGRNHIEVLAPGAENTSPLTRRKYEAICQRLRDFQTTL